MILKPQTYYKSRSGQKIFIDAIVSGNPFTSEAPTHPAVGYIGPAFCCWRLDGMTSDEASEFDIIEEYEDFVSITTWGIEDIDTGELAGYFTTERQAFDACIPGWKVVEMLHVAKISQ